MTPLLERATKVLSVASALAALAVQLELASGRVNNLPLFGLISFGAGFAGGLVAPTATAAAVFGTCYILPAIIGRLAGHYLAAYFGIWLAALLGLSLASGSWSSWHAPRVVRLPIAMWAFTIALAWPIVVLREYDFTTGVIGEHVSNTSVGLFPWFAGMAVADAAAIQLVGFIFFDWLCARYWPDGIDRYERRVLLPLGIGCAISAAVALIQATIDINFFNGGVFPGVGRASGMMRDANPFGVVAALWGPAGVALAIELAGDVPALGVASVLLVSCCALWASGSRNALVAGIVGAATVLWQRARTVDRQSRWVLIGSLAAVLAVVIAFASLVGGRISSPWLRLTQTFNPRTVVHEGFVPFIARLWDPYSYGAAAMRMFREFPLVGVGVGSFALRVLDYSRLVGVRLLFDNAQNWFRHQLVELGMVGSIGWVWWAVVFGYLIVRGRPASARAARILTIVRILPVLVAVVSLVGMPAMNAAVSITFWVFSFWFLLLIDRAQLEPVRGRIFSSAPAWRVAAAVVIVYAVGTSVIARGDLRVPHRAERFDWLYQYGFYAAERSRSGEFFWTRKHAVTVVPIAPGKRWLRITTWVDNPDAAQNPVDIEVRCGRERVIRARRRDSQRLVAYAPVPAGQPRIMIETWSSRTWRPADFGAGADNRDLGLAIAWDFVDSPADAR